MSDWLLALAIPFAATAALVALLIRSRWAARLADHPNERSLHERPTPRVGGIAIVLAAVPLAAHFAAPRLALTFALAIGLALVSFADDLRSLPIPVRIAAHLAAAALAVASLVPQAQDLSFLVAILLTLALAWMTNLFNFMDGSDGLAGGMAAIGFGTYAIAAAQSGAPGLALPCAAFAAAAAGFLFHNFPPARVFMGDAGSIPLGFLAGALGVHGAVTGIWPAWFPLLVFSPFVVDASVTLARRALRRERFWQAHRTHYYQRLVLSGWSPRRLAFVAYALMAAAGASALAAAREESLIQYAIIAVWSGAFIAAIVAIERRAPASATPRGRATR